MRLRDHVSRIAKRPRHYIRWALIHAALVLFGCDLVACLWPAFDALWTSNTAHLGVAVAAFAAGIAETIEEEREDNGN